MIIPKCFDKLAISHAICNIIFTCSVCICLTCTELIYNLSKCISILLLAVIIVELLKLYSSYLCGQPMSKLFWLEDRRSLPYNQKIHLSKGICLCVLEIVGMIFMFYFASVVFGAELFGKCEETLFLSVLLCAMTILPACIHLGPKCTLNLICGIKENSDLAMVIFRNYEFSLLGAWLGACFIPLDWDRPWQEWPIPCVLGSLIGATVVNSFIVCRILVQQSKKV